MAGIDYASVRKSVPMSRVLELLGFTAIRRSGKQLRGPCPVHRSSSPHSRSFSVNLATGAFQCFTCGAAGNQLDLWRQIHGLTLFEAAWDLCRRAQVPVPWFEPLMREDALPIEPEKRNPSLVPSRENS
jgi:DNA primase